MTYNTTMKRVYVFDLDNTLAPSGDAIDTEMASLLKSLLDVVYVCVVSAAGLPQYEKQLLSQLLPGTNLANLILAPTCGGAMYLYTGDAYTKIYEHALSEEDTARIREAIDEAVSAANFDTSLPSYGERFEHRGSQASYSLLGPTAPRAEKEKIDPDRRIRLSIIEHFSKILPDFEARTGGAATIDITQPGIDKAHAVDQLSLLLEIPIEEMVFVGDALYPGGNDEPVLQTGIEANAVQNPEETKIFIRSQI